MATMHITGVVLAGGKGRRMGGVDKGWVNFRGKPMVAHVIHRLQPQVDEILINANREIEHYAALGYPVIEDEIADFAGPLAGLHKAMKTAQHEYVLTVPCDSPLLPLDLAQRLLNALKDRNADLAVAKTGQQTHPVFCLCKKSLLPSLESFLTNGGRKIDAWYSDLAVIEVPFDENQLAFTNVNTLQELLTLEQAT
jgi:molybdopterin-guanine dinucleotide biosynthesis protein A